MLGGPGGCINPVQRKLSAALLGSVRDYGDGAHRAHRSFR